METKHQKLFYTLEKILTRLNISESTPPSTLSEWKEFITYINNSFYDFDQERYLLEQSMELSSQEMIELNEQLENAQKIAHLGYWDYHPKEKRIQFSKEAYRIFSFDPTQPVPSYEQIMKMIHIEDAIILSKLIEQAITQGNSYEKEFRFQNKVDNKTHWLYVKARPYIKKENQTPAGEPGYCLSGIVMDITNRKHAERSELFRHKITKILAENFSLNDTAPELIKITCETLKFDLGELWTVDKAINALRCTTIWPAKSEAMQEFIDYSKKITFIPGVGLPGRVWQQKEICYIKDVVEDPNFPRAAWAKKANLHSAFALPIIFENEVLGVLDFFTQNIFTLDEDMMNLLKDINTQIGIFIAREQAYIQMTILSRQAGMSEIATSVLHNVGNILNSVNISVSFIQELAATDMITNLIRICKLITNNLAKNPEYLVNDEKGKLIPDYLTNLAEVFATNYSDIKKEATRLMEHIDHIKDIVAMQKDISGVSPILQNVSLPQVIDLAIQMSCISAPGIQVIKNYEYSSPITIDKTKLLQILVNLIRNADDALKLAKENHQNIITISVKKINTIIEITVHDNGIGIPKNSLSKIFSMGYTTKPSGHGFGLHSSALAAHELGGSLIFDSAAADKGATFTLVFPENSAETIYQPNKEIG